MSEVEIDPEYLLAAVSRLENAWMDENPDRPIPLGVRSLIFSQAYELLEASAPSPVTGGGYDYHPDHRRWPRG